MISQMKIILMLKSELKSQLLKSKQNTGYNNWLVDIKKQLHIEDYRSRIF